MTSPPDAGKGAAPWNGREGLGFRTDSWHVDTGGIACRWACAEKWDVERAGVRARVGHASPAKTAKGMPEASRSRETCRGEPAGARRGRGASRGLESGLEKEVGWAQ